MKPKVIFITGGSGYIGNHALLQWPKSHCRLVVFDRNAPLIKDKHIEYINGDIRNKEHVRSSLLLTNPDLVIHLAALTMARSSEDSEKDLWETNVQGSRNVFHAMANSGCKHLIFASSAAVYGHTGKQITEEDSLQPLNVYGITKLAVEKEIKTMSQKGLIRTVILRLFNVSGFSEHFLNSGRKFGHGTLMTNTIDVINGVKPQVVINGKSFLTTDGTAVRDYVHVVDVVSAILLAHKQIVSTNKNMIFNVGSGMGSTNLEVMREFERECGKTIPVVFSMPNPNESWYSVADIKRIKSQLGWSPTNSSLQGIVHSVCKYYSVKKKSI